MLFNLDDVKEGYGDADRALMDDLSISKDSVSFNNHLILARNIVLSHVQMAKL